VPINHTHFLAQMFKIWLRTLCTSVLPLQKHLDCANSKDIQWKKILRKYEEQLLRQLNTVSREALAMNIWCITGAAQFERDTWWL
jgi:hypothetical protein